MRCYHYISVERNSLKYFRVFLVQCFLLLNEQTSYCESHCKASIKGTWTTTNNTVLISFIPSECIYSKL